MIDDAILAEFALWYAARNPQQPSLQSAQEGGAL